MLVTEISMPEFEEALLKTKTILLPFGSVEEHGMHLPLGTDTIQIFELAILASKKYQFFVGPPVYYGLCRSTRQHPGTITIRGETLKALTLDLLNSYYEQGLRNFLLLSGHAGGTHMAFLIDAAETFLLDRKDAKAAVASILDLLRDAAFDILETPQDSHAGEFETSLMLFFHSKLVKGTSPEEYPTFPKPILVKNKRLFWPGGVWGDPSKASVEKGRLFAERLSQAIVDLVKRLEAFEELNSV